MDKIFRDYKKAQSANNFDVESFTNAYSKFNENVNNVSECYQPRRANTNTSARSSNDFKKDRQLSIEEKKYLLATERGDIATVKYYLDETNSFENFDMNVVDPLGRNALHIAIEYENIEMIEVLLNYHVDVGEALLHAIDEEFVEAVEMLLHYKDNDALSDNETNQEVFFCFVLFYLFIFSLCVPVYSSN
jgi:ankyrin repeat protein